MNPDNPLNNLTWPIPKYILKRRPNEEWETIISKRTKICHYIEWEVFFDLETSTLIPSVTCLSTQKLNNKGHMKKEVERRLMCLSRER